MEDAEKRRDYLATYDGTIYANGTHTVIGTVLVRTSNKLMATQQKELEQKVMDALTRLEEEEMPDRQSRNMQEISRCQDLWHYNKVGKGWYEYE